MNKNILLVIGTTILFLGISVQTSIATVQPKYIDVEYSSDIEEDCEICPKVSNQNRFLIKILIKRLEKLDNRLSVISKYNPIVAKKYKEVSERISSITEMNNELKQDSSLEDYPILCDILLIIGIVIAKINIFFWELLEVLKNTIIAYAILSIISVTSLFITTIVLNTWANLCID